MTGGLMRSVGNPLLLGEVLRKWRRWERGELRFRKSGSMAWEVAELRRR